MALYPPVRDSLVIPGKLWTTDLAGILLERDYALLEGPRDFKIDTKLSQNPVSGSWVASEAAIGIWFDFPLPWRKDPSFRDWAYQITLGVELGNNSSVGNGAWRARLGPESGNWGDSINSYIEWGDTVNGNPLPGTGDTWGNGSNGTWQLATIGVEIVGIPYGPCQFRVEFEQKDILETHTLRVQRPVDQDDYLSYIQLRRA